MFYDEIIGQEKIISHMKNAKKNDRVSHAYIICGEKGSGKKLLAKSFAASLLCEESGDSACGKCKSCKQVESGNHPDLRYVTHEKPNLIAVDEIRDELNDDILIKPYSSKYKIYIIDEAEKMNRQAQNAMLKTIEEPPEYAVIMLLANNEYSLLQTILSRCITLNVAPVDDKKIVDFLKTRYGVSEYMAGIAAGFSDGNVGRAISYATSDEFTTEKNECIKLVKGLDEKDAGEVYSAVKQMSGKGFKDSDRILSKLSLIKMWYKDVLVVRLTGSTEHVIFKTESEEIKRTASLLAPDVITKKLDAIDLFKRRIKSNVNLEASLMVLMLELRSKK